MQVFKNPSPIKSIQRGVVSWAASPVQSTTNVTISAVDMDKSFVLINGYAANGQYTFEVAVKLTDSTTLNCLKYSQYSTVLNWEVVEYV